MKNQTCIYRDEAHEKKVKSDLESARQSLQNVLNVWNSLDLVPCTDICSLVLNPQESYKKAIDELAVVPITAGRFQVNKQAYINTLDIPVPDELYRACRDCRRIQFAGIGELWNVSGDQVILNESEADHYINAQSIFANGDPGKMKLAKDLVKFTELFNSLNERLGYKLENPVAIGHQFFRDKFRFEQKSYGGHFILEVDPQKVREWLSAL